MSLSKRTEKYEQKLSSLFQKENMMLTLEIVLHKSWIKRFKRFSNVEPLSSVILAW